MDSLTGATLVKADGSQIQAETALKDKDLVLYYFSAHWCPPCRHFTPVLRDFYQEVKEMGVEVVFVSADSSEKEMVAYMKEAHGDWLATQHESAVSKLLDEKYGITGIPTLVVCKKDGTLVTKEGRGHVTSKKPAQAVSDWKK